MIDEHADRLAQLLRIARENKADDCIFERVVHDAVKLVTLQVFPALTVGDFVGGIFPDFTDDHGIVIVRFNSGTQFFQEEIGEFICNVQPISANAVPEPRFQDAVFSEDKFLIGRRRFIDCRERVDAPPAVIHVRIVLEGVPVIIRRIGRLIGANAVIRSVAVKIPAVAPGMVKYCIKDDADTALSGLGNQLIKIFVIP